MAFSCSFLSALSSFSYIACCVLVAVLTLLFSDSFFDTPQEPAFYISNITEWRKDIPTPVVSTQDFPFSSEFQDMHTSEFFELKDTASECSMDSAYQSQNGASRRGPRKPEGQSHDNRSPMSAQLIGSDIYSPSMSSETYVAFQEQALDMSHVTHHTGTWEATEGPMGYANYSAGQDYTTYSNTNMPRFTSPTAINMSSQWVASEAQFQNNPFTFTSYPTSQNSNDMMYNTASSQRHWNHAPFDVSDRPAAVRTSSYTVPEDSRRASVQDASFGAFIATPTSTTSIHLPPGADYDQSQVMDPRYVTHHPIVGLDDDVSRNDVEDGKSASLPQPMDDNEDTFSQSETAESKLEEERTKVARSHVLYQQLPSKDGKYHCPEEGKPGCNHKPTPLKCNYE